jgi:hypothetical protein
VWLLLRLLLTIAATGVSYIFYFLSRPPLFVTASRTAITTGRATITITITITVTITIAARASKVTRSGKVDISEVSLVLINLLEEGYRGDDFR